MKKTHFHLTVAACAMLMSMTTLRSNAQSELYPQHFDLTEVTLLDGPIKTATVLNADLLLQYDADRLMAPFIREAELDKKSGSKYYGWLTKHPSFGNWGQPDWTLEGHVGGHYISALALAYAALLQNSATSDTQDLCDKLKARMEYCLAIMKDCQDAYSGNTEGLMGFIGGQPIRDVWKALYAGDPSKFYNRGGWVPFYCQHKVLAGLRDAYIYAGNEDAKEMFRQLCDWHIRLVSKLDESTMQNVLNSEHGGVNETLADAYKIFGDAKYLVAAKKYSHKGMIDGMQSLSTTFLNNRHANTQVPKYIGFERIYQLQNSATNYRNAARNFWQDVTSNRTVCIGGNSVNEHFLNQSNYDNYISQPDGPETCNSNNMLKLSEDLFDDTHDSRYADFYEGTMFNHILSTQDPNTGGYVYFTTLRPQGYKIYSRVNQGMWCCVGTGMENHSKYAHFAYTHTDNTLYVNLFIASELSSEDFAVRQETGFPYEEQTRLTINKKGAYTIAIRKPSWTDDGFAVKVNGTVAEGQLVSGYFMVNRTWKAGDVIEVSLPMSLRMEECPGLKEYVAFKYGPILLAGDTELKDLQNEYAGEGRMDHSPGARGIQKNINTSPLLICERNEVLGLLKKSDADGLTFTIKAPDFVPAGSLFASKPTLTLRPFFATHHTRYVIYWYQQTKDEYVESDLGKSEAAKLALEERTLDFVGTGEQQSEAGHEASYSNGSTKGSYNGEFYRDAQSGGYIQYTLSNTEGIDTDLSVMCRFTTADRGRIGSIYVEGRKLMTYTIPSRYSPSENGFFNLEIPIPDELLKNSSGKVKTKLKFQIKAENNTLCPGLYLVRLLKDYSKNQVKSDFRFVASEWSTTGDAGRVAQSNISVNTKNNTITVKAGTGANNVCLNFESEKYNIVEQDCFFVVRGTNLKTTDGSSFLWWFNGTNHGTSVAPTYSGTIAGGDAVVVWNLAESGLMDNSEGDYTFSKGWTIFGLTSTTGTSVIKDIAFTNSYEDYMSAAASIDGVRHKMPTDGSIYNMAGYRVTNPTKGLYIVNNKKVLIK